MVVELVSPRSGNSISARLAWGLTNSPPISNNAIHIHIGRRGNRVKAGERGNFMGRLTSLDTVRVDSWYGWPIREGQKKFGVTLAFLTCKD
jgi:hypothetical protein